jgi:prepilin-type N-terminal cleavage/methylation domain-containing protein
MAAFCRKPLRRNQIHHLLRHDNDFLDCFPAGCCRLPGFQAAINLDLIFGNDKLSSISRHMKTGFVKSAKLSRATNAGGFTLLELLVVVGVIAVLIAVQVPVLAGGKSQSKIAMCASHVRQLALSCQIYANENGNRLPVLNGGGASWAWDLPVSAANVLLNCGAQRSTFYCPGTAPRFTDTQNWLGTDGKGTGSLWNFGSSFHLIGYSLAFSGPDSKLATTNQNTTIQPEAVYNFPSPRLTTTYRASERVLVADAILSMGSALPGYAHPENDYTSIAGGFSYNGMIYPHVSPHLKGNVPAGGNLGFKDGHVDWRSFQMMVPRTGNNMPYFWW